MRKLQVLGAALAALFALAVLTASSASAISFLLAEWLVNGVGITTTQLVDIEGEIELTANALITTKILCSGIFIGNIGPNGADDITELLTLGEVLVSSVVLTGQELACTGQQNCPEPLVWADNLPWLTLAELMVQGTEEFFVDLLTSSGAGEPGWHVDCMNGLTDLCRSPEGITRLTNTAEGLDSEFSEAFTVLAELKLANCETAGMEKAEVNGLGFILLSGSTNTLTVSE